MQNLNPVYIGSDIRKYEGVEKLLEVWFFTDEDRISVLSKCPDLRDLKRYILIFLLIYFS